MSSNFLDDLLQRELYGDQNLEFQRKNHVTLEHIKKLGLQKEMDGHEGCVNCLSWNQSGNLLLSGSDDAHVIIWDAFQGRRVCSIPTGHIGNIFSAKFQPNGTDNLVLSAAGDCQIRIHDVTTKEATRVLKHHKGRVKRLAVTPDQPHLFWSCSEDGTVRQFDFRDPDTLSTNETHSLLIDLAEHTGPACEVKCLAINPVFSEQLAIGANDAYARLYDRRMLSSSRGRKDRSWSSEGLDGCVDYFAAGHLSSDYSNGKESKRSITSTYLAFSPDGGELLLNLSGEHVYIFNLNDKRERQKLQMRGRRSGDDGGVGSDGVREGSKGGVLHAGGDLSSVFLSSSLSGKFKGSRKTANSRQREAQLLLAEDLQEQAGESLGRDELSHSIRLYNQAILLNPHSPLLYCQRAIALKQREWDGDVYAGLRDCYTAIQLDDHNLEAHHRLMEHLLLLEWLEEAEKCMEVLQAKFGNSSQLASLQPKLKKLDNKLKNEQNKASQRLSDPSPESELSTFEKLKRLQSFDYDQRFCGHCNTTTDIKEANYFGSNGQYVVAGSDDGSFFIWQRRSSDIVRILNGDSSIVNCLEPHPTACVLATSGIESVVRLWTVQDGSKCEREVSENCDEVAEANQRRMNLDPLQLVLLGMGYGVSAQDSDEEHDPGTVPVNCTLS